jgi:hypothetical protein
MENSEPIEVKAEVVESSPQPTSELKIIEAKPGTIVKSNIAAVKAWVDEQLKTYDVPNIENEDGYKQAKRDRTALRNMGKNVDNERKRVTDLYMAPVNAFRDQVKAITDPIDKLDGKMKVAINKYEDDQKAEKKQCLQTYYEDMAPDIALPLDGQDKALVPFERIFAPDWLNRGVPETAAQNEIEGIVGNLAESEKSLDALKLEHPSEAKAVFWATLDINAAIGRNRELVEAEERQKALEAERAGREAERAAMLAAEEEAAQAEPESAPQPAPMPTPTPARRMSVVTTNRPSPVRAFRYHITLDADFTATPEQVQAIVACMKQNGITGGRIAKMGEIDG